MTDTPPEPGLRRTDIVAGLDDVTVARLLPPGSFKLMMALRPDMLEGVNRVESLARLLAIELAVDDTDRRSILLGSIPPSKLAEFESRVGHSIDAARHIELDPGTRRAMLGFFGVATVSERVESASPPMTVVSPTRGLFPHQKHSASAVEHFLYNETGRAMLHLPTGVGKTRTAMSIVASHLRRRETGLVVWLAGTRELLEQAALEFEATWAAVGDRPIECLRFWGNLTPPVAQPIDGILVAGLAKLHSYGKDRERLWDLGDRATMVVFDEAHQAVAATYRDLVDTLVSRKPRTPLLGLSATPGRTWGAPAIDAEVAELFHGNKVTLDFGDENPIARLTADGYLAAVSFSLLNVEPGLQLSADDLADLAASLDISDELAERLGEDEQRNLRIVQRLLELAETHTRILVFAASVGSAVLLANVCRAVGLEADAVTGTTDATERERRITRFKRSGGKPRALINYGVLTTGFDAPAASAALIARPTKSLVLYSQMVGRVIRGPRAGGTDRCEVITVVDTTLPGFGDVAEAFMNWEDVWTT